MAATQTLSEAVYPVVGKEIPEVIPGISIGFRICGSVTLAYVWINSKLRIGVANCSLKDKQNQVAGERRALKLAFAQHDMDCYLRKVLWADYLLSRGIIQAIPISTALIAVTIKKMRQIRH